jgi:hypothetical protein
MHFVVSIISHAISHRAYTMGPMGSISAKVGFEPVLLTLWISSDATLTLR